jgi:hypothetical protein
LLGTNISILGIFISDEEKSFTTLILAINVMKKVFVNDEEDN